METITAFQCSHCTKPKIYSNAKQAKAHEKKCYHNPETKSCATCQNYYGLEYLINKGQPICSLDTELRKLQTGCEKYSIHVLFMTY